MTVLFKSAILCANDLQTDDVGVPEWGGAVRVHSSTGRDQRNTQWFGSPLFTSPEAP
jgi:hypothetical protein